MSTRASVGFAVTSGIWLGTSVWVKAGLERLVPEDQGPLLAWSWQEHLFALCLATLGFLGSPVPFAIFG